MNTRANTNAGTHTVEAYKVSQQARIGTLPRHFGKYMMTVEQKIFDQMHLLSADYDGGAWDFFELSNGGFFMAPAYEWLRLKVHGNDYEGRMSGEAAGITVCLFAFSLLSFDHRNTEVFARHFHWLRDFALSHGEAREILAAID